MLKKHKISLIITGILLIMSFIPVIQVLIMFLNGSIVGGILLLFKSDDFIIQYIVNGLLSLLFIILFIRAGKNKYKVFAAIGFVFFFFPMTSYIIDNKGAYEPYFLGVAIVGAITGFVLIVASLLSEKFIKQGEEVTSENEI